MKVLLLLIAAVVEIHGMSVPFVQDFVLRPIGTQYANKTTTINGTCDACLCQAFRDNTLANNVALNCFPNNTCQVFPTFPPSYKLQPLATAQLYFLRGIFPNASRCCMPNVTEIVSRLMNTTPTVVQLSYTLAAIGYDEARPDRAVAIGWDSGDLYWFNPWNMSFIKNQTINGSRAIALQNNSIFSANDTSKTVIVLNEQTLASVTNITYPSFSKVRKFLFMNNSRTIMVTTKQNKSVTVLDVLSPNQLTVRVSIIATPLQANRLFSLMLRRDSFPSPLEIHMGRRRSTTRSSMCPRGTKAVLDPTATRTPPGTISLLSITPVVQMDQTWRSMSVVECGS